ncbi:flavin reductase [Micromonospora craniellae]|uniref:flavin reductase n=1 Tax=Micromonospora craniellae TaxID=2294034 RepID=UPI00168B1DBB|nr:flavin reductase [Micromonospora craniellae]QOC90119.1 flavin reductase [Micromonospora craniellae]
MWPCSPAKLRLLAEYRTRRVELVAYLKALREEAADQLADPDSDARRTDLAARFTDWAAVHRSRTQDH